MPHGFGPVFEAFEVDGVKTKVDKAAIAPAATLKDSLPASVHSLYQFDPDIAQEFGKSPEVFAHLA
jgi:hypothetical protein